MSLSAPFIRRPVATTLLTVGLAAAGALAFRLLPVAALPQVDFPTIQVAAALPGASPETMASSVAAPLERQFGRIANVTQMTSTSYLGTTTVVLQFDLDRDIDAAARDVQAAINAARGDLPPNLPTTPSYRKVNPADAPILILALTSDATSKGRMYDAASSIVQQTLSQVEGVGQVFVGGSSLPAVRVEVNPTAVAKYGIGLEDVRLMLAGTNVNRPKGRLTDGDRTWEIASDDQLLQAELYRPLVIAYRDGAAVRLTDVADVEDSVEDVRTAGLSNGKPAVLVIVYRSPGANIIATVDRVRDLLPQLRADVPGEVDLDVVIDRSPPIRASLHDVERTLLIAVALVILVAFAFLGDWRAAAIPTVAVPVSLIGTFGAMYLCGYSLDNLSLIALTISTGFVVDDAIVVLENVTRHIEAGVTGREAALRGAGEIGFTVLSMSISLVAVFIPILLMGGVVGRLFREFAVTLSVAVAISLVVSLTTTPMMCAALLKPRRAQGGNAFVRASARAVDWMTARYATTVAWALRHPRTMGLTTLATVALTVVLSVAVPKGFFPQQDTGRVTGTIQAAQDVSFQAMRDKLRAIVDVIRRDPAVDDVLAFTGGSGGGGAAAQNTGRLFIGLVPHEARNVTADQLIARLRGPLAAIPGAPTYLQAVQDVRIGGQVTGAQYQYTLQAESVDELNAWVPRLLAAMRQVPEIADVSSDHQADGLESTLVMDRPTASRLGVSPALIDATLSDAFGQRQVATMYTPLNQYHVVMEVAPRFTERAQSLRDVYLQPPTSGSPSSAVAPLPALPLAAVTRYEPGRTSLAVNHLAQFPAATVSFNLAPGVALGQAVAAVEDAARRIGLPAGMRGIFQGSAQAFQASLASEPFLILAALATVYVVLGVLYESYVHPLTILSTLPSAGVGALGALWLCGMELDVVGLIGIILLIGIVKKNAIMMIDFALEAQRSQGEAPRDAIYKACLLRFRPIMMTTFAALFGALPLALGRGVGSELRRPLGVAIVGGLLVSQALTLYTTPVVYLYLDDWRLRIAAARARWRGVIRAALTASLALLAGCTVGPRYVRPTVETPAAFKENIGWKVAEPTDGRARGPWWEVFGDPQLNALAARVAASNQSVVAAQAQLQQARALIREARAAWYPTMTIGIATTRSRQSQNAVAPAGSATGGASGGVGSASHAVSEYSLPIDVSWEADVWGRIRRTVEANVTSAQASAADLASLRLSMEAELLNDWFQLRVLDAQRKLLDDTVVAYERSLALTKSRYGGGIASRADVAQAETQLETTRAQAIDLGVQRAQLEHAIAVLVGAPASTFSVPAAPLAATPPAIPAGLPAALLERRPDVAAAERRIASANAQIGVAEAAYYPTVTLSASGGFNSTDVADWLTWGSRFWSVGPAISETIFDGGSRRAQTEAAYAAYEQMVAQYRGTVLTAFQEVEDNLAALGVLEEEARVQDIAVRAARDSVALTTDQYKAGTVSYLNVVTVQATALAEESNAVNILGRRMTASVLLVKAIGGGWNAAELPSESVLTTR